MSVDPSHDRNNAAHPGAYLDYVYALSATGGFTMERRFADIHQYTPSEPVHIDVTDAVQIMMDVATFNTKLGSFREVTDDFSNNSVSISASELISGVTKGAQVFSVGKYSSLYSDFTTYVSSYFGYVGGFSSLFSGASEFAIDTDNTFTGASFVRLLSGEAVDAEGKYISDLTGSITIGSITEILRYAVDANVFGNRDPTVKDWGIADGFVAGDLIWVPTGTTVTLKLGIDAESFLPINNIGPANTASLSQSTTYTNGLFSANTNATTTLISRTLTAPLLIKLVSASTIAAL